MAISGAPTGPAGRPAPFFETTPSIGARRYGARERQLGGVQLGAGGGDFRVLVGRHAGDLAWLTSRVPTAAVRLASAWAATPRRASAAWAVAKLFWAVVSSSPETAPEAASAWRRFRSVLARARSDAR